MNKEQDTIVLAGCRTQPLASYLKAIGILRLLNQQTDRPTLGFWQNDTFCLVTAMTPTDIVDFFLRDYRPTPLISPWNGGSGFYPKDKKDGFDAIVGSSSERLEAYRQAIVLGQQLVGDREESPKDEDKRKMLIQAQRTWRGPLADWLRAALILDSDGAPNYPAILGTGGNDGRLDFTNNFMQRLELLFDLADPDCPPKPDAEAFLKQSLFASPVSDLINVSIGQYSPGSAGGVNSGPGFTTKPRVNPFDFLLMLEGAITFTPAMVRRNHSQSLPLAAAPFAVFNTGAGYGTAITDEKSRGEQWMPIWDRPTGFSELSKVLSEGRCRVGGSSAQRPRDVAQAIGRSGTSRGFVAFERYAYLERNGQANLATPLGKWTASGSQPFVELLDDIRNWVDQFERAARGKNAPNSWSKHDRLINEALMDCCRSDRSTPWVKLLQTVGRAETSLIRSPRATANTRLNPFPGTRVGLSHRWLAAISQGGTTPEVRLAVALAAQAGPTTQSYARPIPNHAGDPIRRHFIPLEHTKGIVSSPTRFAASEDSLTKMNDHVFRGGDPVDEMIEMVRRRILMSQKDNDFRFFPLVPCAGFEANLGDLELWLDGMLDDAMIVELARALAGLNWRDAFTYRSEYRDSFSANASDEWEVARGQTTYAVIRLCFHWFKLPLRLNDREAHERSVSQDFSVRLDPQIASLLQAGEVARAFDKASRRLRSSGLPVRNTRSSEQRSVGRRWLASLAWSLSHLSINRLAESVIHRPASELEIIAAAVEEEA
ncbi:MAG: type I-U CRISPR-associated protein Csx17 [Rubripirellula sp.]